ncbi:PAS domain-containing sensor histidine kinase [Cupriavidus oxalaticus]|uniref:PAS domain-containing sensor histidine kinase n=1 Tax=Cupriavidus oxalaticus TaxID=96344 RepID=UPI00317AF1F7
MNESFPAVGPARAGTRAQLLVALVLALAVFLIDALTPLDIAIAVLYVVVVLLIASGGSRRRTVAAGAACVVLTLVGFVLSIDLNDSAGSVARCVFSLLAITITSLLAIRNLDSTARLREQVQMLNLTHDAIVVYDMQDSIIFWNRGAEEVYGWTADEAISQPVHRLTRTSFPVPVDEIRAELLRTGRWDGELQHMRRDGKPLTISSRWALWRDQSGKPAAILATSNDITKRHQAEAALTRSEAFLAEAQRLSKTGSVALRLPEEEMTWSDEAYRILGYDMSVPPTSDRVLERTHPDDLPLVQEARARLRAGAPRIEVMHRLLMPDGTVKHVHLVARLTTAGAGRLEYVGALMDVTEATLTQQALQRSQTELAHVTRITTLGELAASIAHEVAQPIAAIVSWADAAQRWLHRPQPDIEEATRSIRQIVADAKRSSEIISQIRAMAQQRDPSYAAVDLNALVRDSVELLRRELQDHGTNVTLQLDAPAALVRGDRVQLQQVLVNLVMNAVQAMDGSTSGRRRLWISTCRADAERVELAVRDSGCGIPAGDADHLFNPFFTTKADGMGMGLSICRSIVEAHGGQIWAASPDDGGASLHVALPLQDAANIGR